MAETPPIHRQGISGRDGFPNPGKKRKKAQPDSPNLLSKPRWARDLTLGQTSYVLTYYQQRLREARLAETIQAYRADHPVEAIRIPNPNTRKGIGWTKHVSLEKAQEMLQAMHDANERRGRELVADSETAKVKGLADRGVRRTIFREKQEREEKWQRQIGHLMGDYSVQ